MKRVFYYSIYHLFHVDRFKSQVSKTEAAETAKSETADSIFGQKSGPALAGPATTALKLQVMTLIC